MQLLRYVSINRLFNRKPSADLKPEPERPELRSPASRPTGSLTQQTLIKMCLRIAVVIITSTAISYFHMISSFKSEALGQLEQYVLERVQREEAIFALAEDNHVVLKQEVLRRLQTAGDRDPQPEFDQLFKRSPDGVIRNRPENFDGTRQAGVYIDKTLPITPEIRRRVLIFNELANTYGPAWHNRFQDTYFTTPENIMVLYWPEQSTWAQDAKADLYMPHEEYFRVSDQQHNPERQTVWTGLYYDKVSASWLITCATPIDIAGKHIVTLDQDITLNELLERTVSKHLPGAYNIILRGDGRLIAHPEKTAEIQAQEGNFDILRSGDRHLQQIFQLVKHMQPGSVVVDNAKDGEYLAVAQINGPDWYFVTVFPKSILSKPAFQTARFILILGLISLLIEILILWIVLRRQIAKPLTEFMGATERIAAGEFDIQLDLTRKDELGHLSHLFNSMARQVYAREQSLQQAQAELQQSNEALEARVIDRTTELSDAIAHLQAEITERKQVESALRISEERLIKQAQKLEQTLLELQQTQSHLVQSEKMSSLGQLVAGVAHEINNPVSFIYGNVNHASRYIEDLLRLLRLYQQRYPLVPELQKEAEAIDLNFLVEDLPKLLNSMKIGSERIRQIVLSLRNFSRLDEAEMKPVDIHEGIDNTLLILQHQLRPQGGLPGIEIVKQYGNLPRVECYAGQLNQVFMNILSNAIDALNQHHQEHASNRLAPPVSTITIRTAALEEDDWVEIWIKDNGPGIPAAVRARLFDPFFTTKPVGEGTGLGLAISHQIVVEKHGGMLQCCSEPNQGAEFWIKIPIHQNKALA